MTADSDRQIRELPETRNRAFDRRGLEISAGAGLACCHFLARIGGTMRDGTEVGTGHAVPRGER